MYLRIMRHEWRTLVADKTLIAVTILFALVVAYGIYNGVAWVRAQRASIRALDERREELVTRYRAEVARYEAERETNPNARPPAASVGQAFGVRGYDVSLPPAPLAALSVGQADIYPTSTKVTMWNQRGDLFTEVENENPLNLLAGRFDFAFVIIYLFPLLILALSYNLLSAEKEQGTLQMLLAQPVSLGKFALGKIGIRAVVILGLALLFSLVGVLLSGVSLTDGGALPRIILWVAVVALYGAFWFALAVSVNAFGKSSATNATALAALWLLFVLIIPALLNLIVTAAHPVPSRVELVQATRRAANEAEEQGSRLLAQYFQDHPELLPGNQEINFRNQAQIYYAVQREVARRVEPLLTRYDEQLAKQQRLANLYRFLSPAIITQDALNDLAGTGAARYRYFRAQAERFQIGWHSFFIPKVFRGVPLTSTDYDTYPRFRWIEEPTSAIARRVLFGALGLIALTFLSGLFSLRALRRYPVAG